MDAAQLSYKYEKHKDSITVAKEKEHQQYLIEPSILTSYLLMTK